MVFMGLQTNNGREGHEPKGVEASPDDSTTLTWHKWRWTMRCWRDIEGWGLTKKLKGKTEDVRKAHFSFTHLSKHQSLAWQLLARQPVNLAELLWISESTLPSTNDHNITQHNGINQVFPCFFSWELLTSLLCSLFSCSQLKLAWRPPSSQPSSISSHG